MITPLYLPFNAALHVDDKFCVENILGCDKCDMEEEGVKNFDILSNILFIWPPRYLVSKEKNINFKM